MDGAEDHWTQGSCIDEACGQPSQATSFNAGLDAAGWKGNSIDLWCTGDYKVTSKQARLYQDRGSFPLASS